MDEDPGWADLKSGSESFKEVSRDEDVKHKAKVHWPDEVDRAMSEEKAAEDAGWTNGGDFDTEDLDKQDEDDDKAENEEDEEDEEDDDGEGSDDSDEDEDEDAEDEEDEEDEVDAGVQQDGQISESSWSVPLSSGPSESEGDAQEPTKKEKKKKKKKKVIKITYNIAPLLPKTTSSTSAPLSFFMPPPPGSSGGVSQSNALQPLSGALGAFKLAPPTSSGFSIGSGFGGFAAITAPKIPPVEPPKPVMDDDFDDFGDFGDSSKAEGDGFSSQDDFDDFAAPSAPIQPPLQPNPIPQAPVIEQDPYEGLKKFDSYVLFESEDLQKLEVSIKELVESLLSINSDSLLTSSTSEHVVGARDQLLSNTTWKQLQGESIYSTERNRRNFHWKTSFLRKKYLFALGVPVNLDEIFRGNDAEQTGEPNGSLAANGSLDSSGVSSAVIAAQVTEAVELEVAAALSKARVLLGYSRDVLRTLSIADLERISEELSVVARRLSEDLVKLLDDRDRLVMDKNVSNKMIECLVQHATRAVTSKGALSTMAAKGKVKPGPRK